MESQARGLIDRRRNADVGEIELAHVLGGSRRPESLLGQGKVVSGVLRLAQNHKVPVAVLAGQVIRDGLGEAELGLAHVLASSPEGTSRDRTGVACSLAHRMSWAAPPRGAPSRL